jgi:DNA transformation protein
MPSQDKERQKHFMERCMALLDPLGPVTARRMFGGYGVFFDDLLQGDVMFALVAGEQLYFKCDPQSLPRFKEAGAEPFRYAKQGRTMELSYREAPQGSLESSAALLPWAELALSAARAAQAGKPKAGKPKKRKG